MEWYETVKLAEGVVAVIDRDGGWFKSNSLLVDMGGYTLLVDTQYNEARARTLLEVARRENMPPIRLIVNTHHHGDHAWGNHVFEAPSIMHRGAASMVEKLLPLGPDLYKPFFPDLDFTGARYTRPTIVVDGALEIQGEKRRARIVPYTPAHTIGDIVVELPDDRILAAGDLVFNRVTPLALDGTVKGWLEKLEELESNYAGWKIVPGHGPVADVGAVKMMKMYFRHLVGSVSYLLEHGMPRDPLRLAENATPGPLIGWKEQERLVLNIARLLMDLEGRPPGAPVEDLPRLAQAMVEYRRIFEEQKRRGFPQPPVG